MSQPDPRPAIPLATAPSAFAPRPSTVIPATPSAALAQGEHQQTHSTRYADDRSDRALRAQAVQTRAASLLAASKAARHQESTIRAKRAAKTAPRTAAATPPEAPDRRSGSSLPVTSGYRIAARFGDTGSWSRYHTGIDFSAPIGSTVRAAASGVVTHAGSGSLTWAGRYVTIRHAGGTSTLYAHLASTPVRVGQRVDGGRRIGAVGMTGRTFGPHLHFELYPAGVKPHDPYEAVDPAPWLRARGLRL
jgi:murein DD-endopeptidase MepM/ murein hydrolase activator NlpD